VQIADSIKEQIVRGTLPEGGKLGSVREYAILYEVTALTVQRAIQLLEVEGVIQTRKGVGSFVAPNAAVSLAERMVSQRVREFVSGMKNMGVAEESIIALVEEELKR
jgi:DNA-binding transcriptional regulator YhcF (GntR family)